MTAGSESLIFLSVAGLRATDIDPRRTPTLHAWAHRGALAELMPTFPCVTSCVQASMWTGAPPGKHGVIANGFYHRDRKEVEFWVAHNNVVAGEPVWGLLRRRRSNLTSAVWFAQNIKGASADFVITPAPIHEPDGTMKHWCYSKPEGLYAQLLADLGHFPLQHYWGPLANIQSTAWILRAAAWLHDRHAPDFHWIYIPHLDYAAQKFGSNSPQALAALAELDGELARFATALDASPESRNVTYVVAGEYALTDVSGVVYPNRILRDAGLMRVRLADDRELLDLEHSEAFAMVDHQFAHIYVNAIDARHRDRVIVRAAELFRAVPGVSGVFAGSERAAIGMEHDRSGDIILLSDDNQWFAYYWWLDDALAPAFARTVDIHRKPGYDPVELFFDPKTRSIPLDANLVRGSHGVPATKPCHRAALICSASTGEIKSAKIHRDTEIQGLVLDLMASQVRS